MVLGLIIAATFAVSLVSLIGIWVLSLKQKTLDLWLFILIALSTGTFLGSAFLDLLPEAIEETSASNVLLVALVGLLVFFIIEKIIYWHHHHGKHKAEEKPLAYLNLIGDGFHNFFDGMAIAAGFITNFELGVTTTIAVVLHEIPQEVGDFSLLIYSGFTKTKALLFNFLSGLLAVLGALVFFYFSSFIKGLPAFGLAFTGGMFIYIAVADLLPELQKEMAVKKSFLQLIFILIGIALIGFIAAYLE